MSEEKDKVTAEKNKDNDENAGQEASASVISEEENAEGKAGESGEQSQEETDEGASEEQAAAVTEPERPAAGKKVRARKPEADVPKKEYLPDFPFEFRTVISVLGVITLLAVVWLLAFHPAMWIENIEVNGNYEFTDEQIMDALGIHPGDYILKPTMMKSRALKRSTPYIEGVSVRISLPSTVIIDVTERHKLAYIKVPDGCVAIDADGTILDFISSDTEDLRPVLAGLDLQGVVIGQRTDIAESLKFRKMILVLGAVLDADRGSRRDDGYHFYDSVREVRIVSSGLIFLTVELPNGSVLQVKLAGVENIDENMQWLLYAIRGGAFEDLPAGSLDMTDEEKIYHAYNN